MTPRKPLARLKAARERAGLNQIEAAKIIGRTQAVYSKLERGELTLSAPAALALCNRFGLSLADLLES